MRPTYLGMKAQGMGFDAHLTIYYFGYDVDFREVKDYIQEFRDYKARARRLGIDLFGPAKNIPVAVVWASTHLYTLNSMLTEKFGKVSEFDWNPHITLDMGTVGDIYLPFMIELTDLDVY